MSNPKITNTRNVHTQFLKVLVHGPAGSGKTRLCGTVPGKALIISAEGGLLSLQDKDIDVWQVKTIADLQEAYAFLETDKIYEWVCLDSISEVAELILSTEKETNKDGRAAYGEMQDRMMKLMRRFRDLPKNVYFSAKQERVKDDVTGLTYFGPSAPGNKLGSAMPYLFDLVLALRTWKDDDGVVQRALQTQRDDQYEAKDRSGKLSQAEQCNLGAIYNKIMNKQQENK